MSWFWKGCKPNFVFAACAAERIICLSNLYPKPVSLSRNAERAAPRFPIWPCTRRGFPCRVACASRGALLPHLFTITAGFRRRLFHFLWHCPSIRLETDRLRVSPSNRLELRSVAPCGVRTFLPGLAPGATLRPSKTMYTITEKMILTRPLAKCLGW